MKTLMTFAHWTLPIIYGCTASDWEQAPTAKVANVARFLIGVSGWGLTNALAILLLEKERTANSMEPQWIDYRAWHHDKKVMMHVSEIDFRKRRIKGRAKDEVISARFEEVTLMPWTTYYDDSYDDVMIYEGDIIEVTHKDMKKRFVIDDEMGILLARCIEKEQYPFVDFDLDMLLDDDVRVKVIGNGYENPELLEMKEV